MSEPRGRRPARLERALRDAVVLAALAVLAATLFPTSGGGAFGPFQCLLCGPRGAADALLNVLLFLPLGAAVALQRRSTLRPLLAAVALSAAVEVAQVFIPGRDASPGDLVFNTTGAALGVLLVRTAPRWLAPPHPAAARLSLGSATLAAAVFAATGWLLAPMPTDHAYFPMWTPDLAHLGRYEGRVVDASLGSMPLPHARAAEPGPIRAALSSDTLRVHAVAGPMAARLAPIFAIYDERRNEIVLVGADREDLVFRYRTRAAAMKLDQPDLRIRGALGELAAGEPLDIAVWRDGSGLCLLHGARGGCGLGFTVGTGWRVLLELGGLPAGVHSLLGIVWLAALAAPVGFWARRRWESVAGVGVLASSLLFVPPATALQPTSAREIAAVFAGLLAGAGLAGAVRSDRAHLVATAAAPW